MPYKGPKVTAASVFKEFSRKPNCLGHQTRPPRGRPIVPARSQTFRPDSDTDSDARSRLSSPDTGSSGSTQPDRLPSDPWPRVPAPRAEHEPAAAPAGFTPAAPPGFTPAVPAPDEPAALVPVPPRAPRPGRQRPLPPMLDGAYANGAGLYETFRAWALDQWPSAAVMAASLGDAAGVVTEARFVKGIKALGWRGARERELFRALSCGTDQLRAGDVAFFPPARDQWRRGAGQPPMTRDGARLLRLAGAEAALLHPPRA